MDIEEYQRIIHAELERLRSENDADTDWRMVELAEVWRDCYRHAKGASRIAIVSLCQGILQNMIYDEALDTAKGVVK